MFFHRYHPRPATWSRPGGALVLILAMLATTLLGPAPAAHAAPGDVIPSPAVQTTPGDRVVFSAGDCTIGQYATAELREDITEDQADQIVDRLNDQLDTYDEARPATSLAPVVRFKNDRTLNFQITVDVPEASIEECQQAEKAYTLFEELGATQLGASFWKRAIGKVVAGVAAFAVGTAFTALAVVVPEGAVAIGAVGGCVSGTVGVLVYAAVLGEVKSKETLFNSIFACVAGALVGGGLTKIGQNTAVREVRVVQESIRAGRVRAWVDQVFEDFGPTIEMAAQRAFREAP